MFSVVAAQAIARAQANKHSVTHKGAGAPQKHTSLLRKILRAVAAARLRRAEIELHHDRQLYNDVRDGPRMGKALKF